MKLLQLTEFIKDSGHCWIAELPKDLALGDTPQHPSQSGLRLFEDGEELGPRHALHDQVRGIGGGAYSHWTRRLYLSTSDNSDPQANGKSYHVLAPRTFEVEPASAEVQSVGLPANYQREQRQCDNIAADARYAIGCAHSYADMLPGGYREVQGRSVLELGPGKSFGAALVLRCWGAVRATVADRYLVPFDRTYHVALYAEIAQQLREEQAGVDVTPLQHCMQHGHDRAVVEGVEIPLEALAEEYEEAFDLTASNAVLEHLFDPLAGLQALYKLTARGGFGFHQVDFRDHRDFSRPLEYLLLDEWSFSRQFNLSHGEIGNRLRPHQMTAMLEAAGFAVRRFDVNMTAEDAYLSDFLPRLRQAALSPYRDCSEEHLRPIAGRLHLVK
jgi:SAM-dependent methyltransferase